VSSNSNNQTSYVSTSTDMIVEELLSWYTGHTAVAVMRRSDESVSVSRCCLDHIVGQSAENWLGCVPTMAATNTITYTHVLSFP